MDVLELAVVGFMLLALSFGFGAMVMWSLEGRNRRAQPLWLVVYRDVWFVAWAVVLFTVMRPDPGAVAFFMPAPLWDALGAFSICAAIVVLVAEVRYHRKHHAGGGRV